MITIEKIKRSYDRYAVKYDTGTDLQRRLADKLISVVRSDYVGARHALPLRVLDVGCGTGYLTSRLNAIGCDISFGMLSCAKNNICRGTLQRAPTFIQSDANRLPFATGSFDLVVSNAAYQWVNSLLAAFKEVKRVLKNEGKFYFVVFGKNTLWQLQSVCGDIKIASSNFPDEKALSTALHDAGFKITSMETFGYEKYYKDLWELLSSLKNIGSTSTENKNIAGLGWRKTLEQINNLYLEKFGSENGIPVTYEAFLIKTSYE